MSMAVFTRSVAVRLLGYRNMSCLKNVRQQQEPCAQSDTPEMRNVTNEAKQTNPQFLLPSARHLGERQRASGYMGLVVTMWVLMGARVHIVTK